MKASSLSGFAASALLLAASLVSVGCTSAQTNDILNRIQSQIPAAIQFANTAGVLAKSVDPAIAVEVDVALLAINAGLPLLQRDIQAYLAHPDATLLGKIEATINEVVSQGASTLSLVSIHNTGTQQQVLAALGALQGVLLLIDGFIQQIQSASVTKANAAARTVKLSQLRSPEMRNEFNRRAPVTFAAFAQHEQALGF